MISIKDRQKIDIIIRILKKKFNNLSANELLNLSADIIQELEEFEQAKQ